MIHYLLIAIFLILIILAYYFLPYPCPKENVHIHSTYQTIVTMNSTRKRYIPNNIYMTYHEIQKVPQYVFDNIKQHCSGYNLHIYDDEMCIDFLQKHYNSFAVKIFKNMRKGAHKADFWRYCMLYKFGGYYFDIKTDFQEHIDNIYDPYTPKKWYTVLSKVKGTVFNGIIVTPPNNPYLYKAIKYIYTHRTPITYLQYCRNLYNIIKEECEIEPHTGENYLHNDWIVHLHKESCTTNCGSNCDRYGGLCTIADENNKLIFNTRYNSFPW